MKRIFLGAVGAALLSCVALAAAEKLPSPDKFLFWSASEQALGYRSIEKIFPRLGETGTTAEILELMAKMYA